MFLCPCWMAVSPGCVECIVCKVLLCGSAMDEEVECDVIYNYRYLYLNIKCLVAANVEAD